MSKNFYRGIHKPGRKSKRLHPKPLILIICEGGKTEPEYFHCIRISKKISKERIRILTSKECKGTDPLTLVSCAKTIKKQMIKYEGLIYDEVWCVFDHDDHLTINQAMNKAKDNKISVAFSNPCFEIWCLLHFKMQTGYIERDKLIKELGSDGCITGYNKGIKDCFKVLEERMAKAINRAERLRKYHTDSYKEETSNPSTTVDGLAKLLMSLN